MNKWGPKLAFTYPQAQPLASPAQTNPVPIEMLTHSVCDPLSPTDPFKFHNPCATGLLKIYDPYDPLTNSNSLHKLKTGFVFRINCRKYWVNSDKCIHYNCIIHI